MTDVHDSDQEAAERRTFLRVAEAVLERAHFPLKAREIVERAIDEGLFGDHALGRTPEKSMQARLSVEILTGARASRFVRTSRGRFSLRSRLGSTSDARRSPLQEYEATPRQLSLPKEDILCLPRSACAPVLTFQGLHSSRSGVLPELLTLPSLYVPRAEVESIDTVKQVVTYVIVQCGHRVLSFERSYLSRAAEFLRGYRCIGFGGHVSAEDYDLFSAEDKGISTCARRELSEELRLPELGAGPATEPALRTQNLAGELFFTLPLELVGVLNDDSSAVGRRHVAVVLRVWIDDWSLAQRLVKGESSMRALTWIDLRDKTVDLNDFEYWSQLCLRKMYPSTPFASATVKVASSSALKRADVLLITGRVGSGKSETARYLSAKLGVPAVNSGRILAGLMGSGTLESLGRQRFQEVALEFIRSADGPARLARAICTAIADSPFCIVDGVRQLETYDQLHNILGDRMSMFYVQTPPDAAYEFYRTREVDERLDFTYSDFLTLYDAEVEADIGSLGRKADAYIYNASSLDELRRAVDSLAAYLPAN